MVRCNVSECVPVRLTMDDRPENDDVNRGGVWPPPVKRQVDDRPTKFVKWRRHADDEGVRAIKLQFVSYAILLAGSLLCSYWELVAPLFPVFGLASLCVGVWGWSLGVSARRSLEGKVAVVMPFVALAVVVAVIANSLN